MKKSSIDAQLNNVLTYQMYLREMLSLAENVFIYDKVPNFIDMSYVNKTLVRQGAIAFFQDEEIGVLALPFRNNAVLDCYGRPIKIQVYGLNGYTRDLNKDEFVIMYDNEGRYPLILDIYQYAQRIALCTRVIDININQQKTPRFWKVPNGEEKTIKNLQNYVDRFEEAVCTYDKIGVNDIESVLSPAPYISNLVREEKERIWNEYLRLIGISNVAFQKKERNIKDEILMSQGGTIASRGSRFEPRKKAIEEINLKFNLNIEVKFYDGIPNSNMLKEYVEEGEEEIDV